MWQHGKRRHHTWQANTHTHTNHLARGEALQHVKPLIKVVYIVVIYSEWEGVFQCGWVACCFHGNYHIICHCFDFCFNRMSLSLFTSVLCECCGCAKEFFYSASFIISDMMIHLQGGVFLYSFFLNPLLIICTVQM